MNQLPDGRADPYDRRMPAGHRTLTELGETALIRRIARRAGRAGRDWALGIGDDAAILRTRGGEELVFSSDAQVENVHFRFDRESPRTIGRRALAVNLSDLAAMGAEPVGALLNLAAPPDARVSVFDSVIKGFTDDAKIFECPLVGGNLSRAEVWSLDVTVIGRCASGASLRRRGVRPGDDLYVTGVLGAAALARLKADRAKTRLSRVPIPRIAAGRALAKLPEIRAYIDVSDGLATDLAHLLASDGLGAEIDSARLPRPRGFDRACAALGLDPLGVLAGAGEDYELLFAFRSERNTRAETRLSRLLGVPVTRVGVVSSGRGVRGLPVPRSGHHF